MATDAHAHGLAAYVELPARAVALETRRAATAALLVARQHLRLGLGTDAIRVRWFRKARRDRPGEGGDAALAELGRYLGVLAEDDARLDGFLSDTPSDLLGLAYRNEEHTIWLLADQSPRTAAHTALHECCHKAQQRDDRARHLAWLPLGKQQRDRRDAEADAFADRFIDECRW